tara:strand:+ start:165 stop:458 length:294 start_codon:yes stop_codon:yes gene_type:complete
MGIQLNHRSLINELKSISLILFPPTIINNKLILIGPRRLIVNSEKLTRLLLSINKAGIRKRKMSIPVIFGLIILPLKIKTNDIVIIRYLLNSQGKNG